MPISPALEKATLALIEAKARKAMAEAETSELELDEAKVHARFQRNSSMRNRTLPFVGAVEPDGVEQAVDILSRWARESNEPITVRFTSPGGEIGAGFVLYDALRGISADGVPIKTVVLGDAFSMAAVLLQAGDERVIGPHGQIMIHKGSVTVRKGATIQEAELSIHSKQMAETDKMMAGVLAERSTLTSREILAKITKGDWYLKAADCQRFGFADRVGYK